MSEASSSSTARDVGAVAAKPRGSAIGLFVRFAVLLLAAAMAYLFVARWDVWVGSSTRQTTDDAYVRSDITPISAKVDGYVHNVPVDDFQMVKAGELLVEIDDDDYQAQVAQAEAALLGAQAAIENLKAHKALQHVLITEAENTIAGTQADVVRTTDEAKRQQELLATTFGTTQKVEQAVADEKRFGATLARNRAELEAQRSEMGVLDTQESQLRADMKAKQALLDLAKINLGYTKIVAPIDGMVSERGVQTGEYLHAGTQVFSVVPLQNVWVTANYKETQLTHVAVGQKVQIVVDTFPGVTLTGHVEEIAPASGSQFSLLPPDNATGNFTKVVQRIPVKIALDPGNPLTGKLRPGMSATTTILTDTAKP
jgi:membrane fusion protein (multidrug efflux system)